MRSTYSNAKIKSTEQPQLPAAMAESGPEANSPARGRVGPVRGVLRPLAEAMSEMLGYGSRLP